MRYVVIPAAILLLDPRTKKPLADEAKEFVAVAYELWFNDARVAEGGPLKLRRWSKLVDKFDKYSKPGDVVVLEDEDWRLLKSIVETPKANYPTLIAMQLDTFSCAVLDAGEEDPRKAKADAVQANVTEAGTTGIVDVDDPRAVAARKMINDAVASSATGPAV